MYLPDTASSSDVGIFDKLAEISKEKKEKEMAIVELEKEKKKLESDLKFKNRQCQRLLEKTGRLKKNQAVESVKTSLKSSFDIRRQRTAKRIDRAKGYFKQKKAAERIARTNKANNIPVIVDNANAEAANNELQ